MPDTGGYIRNSIDLNLFFLRIMKEHSFFLQIGFMPKDSAFSREAAEFRKHFEALLGHATHLANGIVGRRTMETGQFVTQYTLDAERATQYYTGIPFDTRITEQEMALGERGSRQMSMVDEITELNKHSLEAVCRLIDFKRRVLADVVACRIFTVNYPLLIDHILREARLFAHLLEMLLSQKDSMNMREFIDQEAFWNRIMAEHAKFIAGLLDPTEENLIDSARMFGKQFDQLTKESAEATRSTIGQVTSKSLKATYAIRDFKSAGTKGILECNIKSIIIPLLGDHVLREANHFITLLKQGR